MKAPPRLDQDPEFGPSFRAERATLASVDLSSRRAQLLAAASTAPAGAEAGAKTWLLGGLGVAALLAAGTLLWPLALPEPAAARMAPAPALRRSTEPMITRRLVEPSRPATEADDDPAARPVEAPAPARRRPQPASSRRPGRSPEIPPPPVADVGSLAARDAETTSDRVPSLGASSDLRTDLEDYDRAHGLLTAGQNEAAVEALRGYLEDHPDGRLRLEAELDLVEVLVRLDRKPGALRIAERLLENARAQRRAELVRIVVSLRAGLGDCLGARHVLPKGDPELLEAVRRCVERGE